MYDENISIFNIPKDIGYYEINDRLRFTFYKKPNWFHRKMTRILLGWKWIDHKDSKK